MHTLNLACQSINLSKSFPFVTYMNSRLLQQIQELKQHQKKYFIALTHKMKTRTTS